MRVTGLCALVVLVAVCSGCSSGSQPIALTFPSGSTQAIDNGQSINITVTIAHDKNAKGVMWSLTGPGTLTNQTTNSVTYNAPAVGAVAKATVKPTSTSVPLAAGADPTAMVTATSVADPTKSASVTITVTPPPSITTTSLPAGTEGTAYTQIIGTSGGAGTLSLTVSTGGLPAGLSMDSSGHITGTPTGPNATASFTVKVTDSSSAGAQSATQNLSIAINLPPAPSITTTSLPAGVEGTAYGQTIAATGGLTPYTFSVSSGTLPTGLALNSSTGAITGTPTGPNGASNFTVKLTDKSNPAQSATQNLSITINLPPAPTITTTSLPAGVEGTAYSQTIHATGFGALTYSISAGTLPAGLSLNSSTGAITGTPLGPNTTSNFTVTVTDSSNPKQTGSKALSIMINLPAPPAISPTTLPNGNVGTPYSQTLTVSGGLGPTFTWVVSSGTLPVGLVLTGNNATAKISGTPTTAQTNVAFTIQVTDSSVPPQSGTQNYTVTINPPAPLSITTTSLPNGAFNTAYNATISATGGIAPYTFSLDAASSPLPAGLAFTNDAANNQGVISGTPTTAGIFTNIIVDVHDSQVPAAATASKTFALTITAPAIVISPSSLPNGTVNTAYSVNITATGGVTPYTFSLDAASSLLPAGLSFSSNATSATISGTPTAAGTTNSIVIDVKDSEQPQMTKKMTYSITINASSTACGTGHESVLNGQYAFVFQGFDASGPVALAGSFTADGTGKLTAGEADFNSSAGVATAIPTTTASSSYSVGSDNRGCITVVNSFGTFTYRFALGSISSGVATRGRFIEFDTTGTLGSGEIAKQNPTAFSTAQVTGGYAFGLPSTLSLSLTTRSRVVTAGSFQASGGVISAGEADTNLNGTIDNGTAGPETFTGSYTVASNGRGTMTFNVTSPAVTIHSSFYVVSASELLVMSTDPQASGAAPYTGKALQQSGGPFSTSSLSGNSVFAVAGLCGGCGTTVAPVAPHLDVGILNVPTPGSFSYSADENKGGGALSTVTASGTYTVDSAGRVLISTSLGAAGAVYLAGPNRGFIVLVGKSVQGGTLEPQTGGPFSNASLNGTFPFGTTNQVDQNVSDDSGLATFDGTSGVTGTSDSASIGSTPSTPNLSPGQTFTNTYTVTNGAGTPGRGTVSMGGTLNLIFYIISPSKAVLLGAQTGNAYPSITIGEK